ncbi:CRISPR-associated protein Csm2 [Methylomarinovum tepidoasis]|uniref:CRISPR system Cms protein Csm2 n=1 Tax=Methylomarinovum tepidoasis TaxID=2840183 RepID=A0AAU9CHW2_9GAMM|nr:type III-A CRISPR-associated protein Csm2 [Methylomarinovum sp. IN45]BCX88941.1 CRISPR-associated protein Csm2 [Methylomarinovum sp. IN45]
MNHQQRKSSHRREDRTLGFTVQFRTEDGKIHPELFDKTAHKAAETVADCKKEVNKSTQLRRFYDELVMWEEKTTQNRDKFEDYLPFIRMLKAKAAYAQGRKLVDGRFVDLLDQTIDFVRTADDLRIAKLFLEAFLGFYKLEKGD